MNVKCGNKYFWMMLLIPLPYLDDQLLMLSMNFNQILYFFEMASLISIDIIELIMSGQSSVKYGK